MSRKLYIQLIGAGFGLIGLSILLKYLGWSAPVGVFMMIAGNNIERSVS